MVTERVKLIFLAIGPKPVPRVMAKSAGPSKGKASFRILLPVAIQFLYPRLLSAGTITDSISGRPTIVGYFTLFFPPVGVICVPGDEGLDGVGDGSLRFPAQNFLGFFDVGDFFRVVSHPRVAFFQGDFFAGDFLYLLDDFQNRVAGTGTEIDNVALATLYKILQCLQVSFV